MRQGIALSLAIATLFVAVIASPVPQQSNSALESAVVAEQPAKELVRDKRTIGVLRDLFPNFSQLIDRKIQALTRIIFRLVGRLVLNNGGGGGGGDNGGRTGTVSIVLPTYPPSEDDDEDEDESEDTDSDIAQSAPSTTTEPPTEGDEENKVDEGGTRKKRQADDDALQASENDDSNNGFLNFNLAGSQQSTAPGSGNFIFDVIRLVSGSGSGSSSSSSSSGGGGGGNSADDDGQLEPSSSENIEQGYDGLGVPGPLTRLFVIANRGVASLIQDLILRLAQASEKVVNYKARLITSII